MGAGVFGVSAAIALSSRGWEVELVDPGPLPRPEAASTDISKIVRMDYGSDALYSELMERALPLWRDWNAKWRDELYHEDGFLVLSNAPLQSGGFEHDSLRTLEARGHTVERLDSGSLGDRFPAWTASRYPDGYYNPKAGWVERPRLGRMIDDAKDAGGACGRARGSRVHRRRARVGASSRPRPVKAMSCSWPRAWTSSRSLGVMWPVAQPVFHLRPDDPAAWRPPRFTVWAAAIASTGWYGFPATASGVVKIANHGPGRRVHPDAPRVIEPDDERRLREFLRESLPGLADAPLVASKTCLYCDAFDGDFWIGRDPDRPGLAVAAGDSGHGFKFAPVLGDVIADAIEEKRSPFTERFAWRMPSERKAEFARWGLS